MLINAVSTLMLFILSFAPCDYVICCHAAPSGAVVCTFTGTSPDCSCASGDKAIVCRKGVGVDPETGNAYCYEE